MSNRKSKSIKQPRFSPGTEFFCTIASKNLVVAGTPSWNGRTHMYAFQNTDLRCGEEYLKIKR